MTSTSRIQDPSFNAKSFYQWVINKYSQGSNQPMLTLISSHLRMQPSHFIFIFNDFPNSSVFTSWKKLCLLHFISIFPKTRLMYSLPIYKDCFLLCATIIFIPLAMILTYFLQLHLLFSYILSGWYIESDLHLYVIW